MTTGAAKQVQAVEAVAAAVSTRDARLRAHRSTAVKAVALVIGERSRLIAATSRKLIEKRKIKPVDPFDLRWNVFRMFGREHHEPSWTQWLGNLLRPQHGGRVARIAWRALCRAASDQKAATSCDPPWGGRAVASAKLARPKDWLLAGEAVPETHDEVSAPGLGTVDLVVSTPGLLAIVENKLWADWHDWEEPRLEPRRQADRYRKLGLDRSADPTQRLGMVLLTAKDVQPPTPSEGDQHVPSDWLVVQWRSFGAILRAALRQALIDTPTEQEPLITQELLPLFLTLCALERDVAKLVNERLLEVLIGGALEPRDLLSLVELADYMGGDRGQEDLV